MNAVQHTSVESCVVLTEQSVSFLAIAWQRKVLFNYYFWFLFIAHCKWHFVLKFFSCCEIEKQYVKSRLAEVLRTRICQ